VLRITSFSRLLILDVEFHVSAEDREVTAHWFWGDLIAPHCWW